MKAKLLLVAILIFAVIAPTASIQATENIAPTEVSQLISGEKTLVIGHIANFPPFYIADTTAPKGLDPSIFSEIAKRAGIKNLTYKSYADFTALNNALQQGDIDIIVNDYWNIPAHSDLFLLTKPYYLRDGVAYVYNKDKKDFEDLKNLEFHHIGVFKSATDVVSWLQQHPIENTTLKFFDTREELIEALQKGKIDAAFVYYTLYLAMFNEQSKANHFSVKIVEPIDSTYAVRKQDTALHQHLNQVIESMWKDGSLYQIKQQYLSPLGIEPAHSH